jgi:hypothetical protein
LDEKVGQFKYPKITRTEQAIFGKLKIG